MSNILQIGFTAEGTTDKRFLQNIIWRTFQDVALECNGSIDVYEPEYLIRSGDSYSDQILKLTIKYSYFHVICVHRDADASTTLSTITNLIDPAFSSVNSYSGQNCKNLIPIIPVQMTESWMLADRDLLREKIGTNLSYIELGLPNKMKHIESISNPKDLISNAIIKAKSDARKRHRRELTISNLYSPISQELDLKMLEQLPSYKDFKNSVRIIFQKLNYH